MKSVAFQKLHTCNMCTCTDVRQNNPEKYSKDGSELECTEAEKDLGTIIDMD